MSKHTLPMDIISDMIDNYRNHQLKSIENSTTSPMVFDAHSAWFSLDELKDLIATIESEVSKNPGYPTKNLGLRLYYAAYPKEPYKPEEGFVFPKDYEKLHTLIAVPTTEIGGNNQDFDPADTSTYTGTKPIGVGISIIAENHANLGPPASLTGEWF